MVPLVRVSAREVGESQLDNQALWVSATQYLLAGLRGYCAKWSGGDLQLLGWLLN